MEYKCALSLSNGMELFISDKPSEVAEILLDAEIKDVSFVKFDADEGMAYIRPEEIIAFSAL